MRRSCGTAWWNCARSSTSRLLLPGLTQPRTLGSTFVRTKVNRKSAKTKVLDSFIQSGTIRWGGCAATEATKSFGDLIPGGLRVRLRLSPS